MASGGGAAGYLGGDVLSMAGGAVAGGIRGRRAVKRAEEQKRERLALINSMDWEPEYASTRMPTYTKPQSPIARAYLESMLLGANPSQIASNAPGAAGAKAVAQLKQSELFGTPGELRAQQREADAATPWELKPMTRKIRSEANDNTLWQAQNKGTAEHGITEGLVNAVRRFDRGADTDYVLINLVKTFGSANAAISAVQQKDPAALKIIKTRGW